MTNTKKESKYQKKLHKLEAKNKVEEAKIKNKVIKDEKRKEARRKFLDFSLLSYKFLSAHPQAMLMTILVIFYLIMNLGIGILALQTVGVLSGIFFLGETLLQIFGLFYALNYVSNKDKIKNEVNNEQK
ncbi:hypothetical protein [Lactococcus lactis]|uniref:hypothetical protein n=1 Tax=Lactococcus lactis TaxID=1358 RepID=UPI00288F4A13|nr:hypothetical protein [Lactococcus lactis]MDT2909284.1 hypothetical protein [Lactococcus lactis]MDT2925186.1 hypothetical protein [Lactococcus lactis]MDT2952045.1 hypothetical protein [Lactococcus lactis]